MSKIKYLNVPPLEFEPVPIIVVKSFLILVTSLGNLLVIIAVGTTKKLRRTPNNIFISALAVVDMLVGMYVMPLGVFSWLIQMGCGRDINTTGFVLISIYVFLMMSTMWMLAVISYDRYCFISDSLNYAFWMNKRRMWIFIISGSLLIPALSTAISFIVPSLAPEEFEYVFTNLIHFTPIIITTVNYVRIIMFIKKKTRGMSADVKYRPRLGHTQRVIKRTAYTIGILVSALLLLVLPLDIYDFYIAKTQVHDCRVRSVLSWLTFVNSTVNPVVYTVFNKDFRQAIFRVSMCRSLREELTASTRGVYLVTPQSTQTPHWRSLEKVYVNIEKASATVNNDGNNLETKIEPSICATSISETYSSYKWPQNVK